MFRSLSLLKEEKKPEDVPIPSFLSSHLGPRVATIIEAYSSKIHDDSFLKIIRQLEFWHSQNTLDHEQFLALAERLAKIATWRENAHESLGEGKFTVPKVRFGRTEVQIPIITCGGMRVQDTWIPDTVPLLKPNKSKVVKSPSQQNLKDVILNCLRVGLNHFETARFYGSSELQFVDALAQLIEEKTIKRADFIFQTKLFPMEKKADFVKQWDATWSNVSRLEYIDLFSFHCVSDDDQIDNLLNETEDGIYQFALDLQKEGRIKHIGFSTHGSAETIMRMINSNKFSYVNIHKHYFGDYHAAGTPDTRGGQGNGTAVKRALELDMGVFQISPFDKGGKLYRPSTTVAAAIGPELSPIAFAALHAWKTQGMHTVSVGFARASDLDEVIEAARLYTDASGKTDALLKAAEAKLDAIAVDKLGKEWFDKGLLNVPSFYTESSDGMAIGHMLWLHNCLSAYGMYEFAKDRYGMLEGPSVKWKKGKTYEENRKKCFNAGNPGRSYDPTVDLTQALKDHYNPELVQKKLAECHEWLNKDTKFTDEERAQRGWSQAYNLTTWGEYPGEIVSVSNVLLGRMGLRDIGGPTEHAAQESQQMRGIVRRLSSVTTS
ncbi:hypothetical protein ACHAW6_013316 [Cyclotella cf. meneghiniana]